MAELKEPTKNFLGRALDREIQANGPSTCVAIPIQRPKAKWHRSVSFCAMGLVVGSFESAHRAEFIKPIKTNRPKFFSGFF